MREIFVENPEASAEKISEFPRQFLPPSQFYQSRQRLISKIKELKIPVEVPLVVVEEQEDEDESLRQLTGNSNHP